MTSLNILGWAWGWGCAWGWARGWGRAWGYKLHVHKTTSLDLMFSSYLHL